MRVAVLQQVTSGYLVLKPSDGQYQVKFDSGASCEVAVTKVAGGEDDSREAEPKEKRDTAASATEAKDYLERHNVLQFVQAVLQAVIKERPQDPYAYMARHFMSGYSDKDVRSPKPGVSPKASASPQDASSLVERPPVAAAAEALRQQVHRTLVKANEDGTLSSSLEMARRELDAGEAKPEDSAGPAAVGAQAPVAVDAQALKLQIKSTLVQAGRDGILASALRDALKTESGAPTPRDQDLRRQIQETLVEAGRTGKLSNALKEMQKTGTPEEPAAEAATAVAAAEGASAGKCEGQDLRLHTKNALLEATASGRLAAALQEVHQDSSQELRERTRDTLWKAAQDGSLNAAVQTLLNDIQEKGEVPTVKDTCQQVQEALGKAAAEGTLAPAIKTAVQSSSEGVSDPAEAPRTQDVCSHIQETLLQASQDGSLVETIGKVRGEFDGEARGVLKDTLVQAFQDGALGPALQKVLVAG